LSYKEKLELAALPDRIERLEAEIQVLHADMAKPEFYQQAGTQIAAEQARLQALDAELATAYERWATLEPLAE
jgi:ATP-binding cassette subfamily F protein uup